MIKPNPIWPGNDRINWLCLFMQEFVGKNDLTLAPLLLYGYRSIQSSGAMLENELAVYKIRQLLHRFSSLSSIKKAVVRYNEHHLAEGESYDQRLFNIDEKMFVFTPLHDVMPPEYQEAKDYLLLPIEYAEHGQKIADTNNRLFVDFTDIEASRRFDLTGIPKLSPPSQHAFSTDTAHTIDIPLTELLAEAEEMDELDTHHKRRAGNWASRLNNVLLEIPLPDGTFSPASSLSLSGLKHLIGLPGAGKTTLLMCLTRWLAKKQLKTVILFPSVEVSRQYLTTLQDYGVKAGLLMGRSNQTRARHAHQLAENLACGDTLKGFANDLPGMDYFGTNCLIPTYTVAPEEGLIPTSTYCDRILEKTKNTDKPAKRLCPLWSHCGYHKSSRELPEATVWLGHIASLDTTVPQHSTALNYRYFELIAQEFDVVIVDEADQVQAWLDDQGVSRLTLTGDSESFHADLHKRQNQMTVDHNFALGNPNVFNFVLTAMDFSRHSHMLVNTIQSLDDEHSKMYQGIFLTSSRIINAIITGEKGKSGIAPELEDVDTQYRHKEAVTHLWEHAAYTAFYNRQGNTPNDNSQSFNAIRVAKNLGLEKETIVNMYDNLVRTFRVWLTEERNLAQESLKQIKEHIYPLLKKDNITALDLKIKLLVSVTFTIYAYRRLAPHSDALIEQGFLAPSHVEQRGSDELLKFTNDNILGSLSGVRFFLDSTRQDQQRLPNVRLQYAVFSGSPRALLYHLHKPIPGATRSPAILLASATSFLEESPAYHINKTPDYIARAHTSNKRFEKSKFHFSPIPNPTKPGTHLRYSGEPSPNIRENNLKKMVEYLLKDGLQDSVVGKAIQTFDAEKRQRKAAFVVNSYMHCEIIKRYIDRRFPEWSTRSVALVKDINEYQKSDGYVTRAQVELLGDQDDVQLIIFPMEAIGRGTNIVFTKGERRLDAAIGTMYFLTRPHPTSDDLSLLISIAAKNSEQFNQRDFTDTHTVDQMLSAFKDARRRTYGQVWRLLLNPLIASRLGDLMKPFTANCSVSLLQTIGRGMRNSCPVQCHFVDAAWASKSVKNDPANRDTKHSSMLVQLIEILEDCINHKDPQKAAIYKELYEPFLTPLNEIPELLFCSTDEPDTLGSDDAHKDSVMTDEELVF